MISSQDNDRLDVIEWELANIHQALSGLYAHRTSVDHHLSQIHRLINRLSADLLTYTLQTFVPSTPKAPRENPLDSMPQDEPPPQS